MGRSLGLSVLVGLALLAAAAPAGSGGAEPPPADGLLVLAVAGRDGESGAVTRELAMVADPRTGQTRARRLAGGTLCYSPVLAVGEHVVFGGVRGRHRVARALPLSLTGAARSLGRADALVASAVPGRLWLGSWTPGRRPRLTLREVDARDGLRARVRAQLPGSTRLHAALADGFVTTERRWLTFRRRGERRPRLRVRDGWFAAAQASRFAWCRGRCRALHAWGRSGDRVLRPPAGMRPLGTGAAFSPDGRRLAVGVSVRGRTRVALVELRSGRWTVVPGGELAGYSAIAWSPSGRWLYFTGGDRRLLGWRLGAARAVRLPIHPGGTVMSIATAAPRARSPVHNFAGQTRFGYPLGHIWAPSA